MKKIIISAASAARSKMFHKQKVTFRWRLHNSIKESSTWYRAKKATTSGRECEINREFIEMFAIWRANTTQQWKLFANRLIKNGNKHQFWRRISLASSTFVVFSFVQVLCSWESESRSVHYDSVKRPSLSGDVIHTCKSR